MMGGEFDQLSDQLKTILSEVGFSKPTPIQHKAIPEILNGHNVLLISATGSGIWRTGKLSTRGA